MTQASFKGKCSLEEEHRLTFIVSAEVRPISKKIARLSAAGMSCKPQRHSCGCLTVSSKQHMALGTASSCCLKSAALTKSGTDVLVGRLTSRVEKESEPEARYDWGRALERFHQH